MATIANLNAKLGLSANGFFSAIGKVKSELTATKGWVRNFSSGISGIGAAIAGLGVAAGAAGITAFIHKNLEGVDSLGKLSDKLSISTESLGKLKYAGDLAGVGIDEIGAGVSKMSKYLGEAVNGSTEAQAKFTSLGLDFNALAQTSPEKALGIISDRLNEIQNPAQRTAAIMDIFGKSGLELNGILQLGSEGLNQYGAEADKLGLIFSRTDASQVEAANDAVTTALSLLTALGQRIAIELSPFIRQLAADFTDSATSGMSMSEIVSKGIGFLTDTISYLGNAVDLLKIPFKAIQTLVNGVLALTGKQLEYILGGVAKLFELAGQDDIAKSIHGWSDAAKGFGDSMIEEAKASANDLVNVFTGPQAGDKVSKWFENAKKNSNELAAVVKKSTLAIDESLIAAGNDDKLKDSRKAVESIISGLQSQLDHLELSPIDELTKKIENAGGDLFDMIDAWNLLSDIELAKNAKLAEEARKNSFETQKQLADKGVEFLTVNSNKGQAVAAGLRNSNDDKRYEEDKKQTKLLASIAKNTSSSSVIDDYYEGL